MNMPMSHSLNYCIFYHLSKHSYGKIHIPADISCGLLNDQKINAAILFASNSLQSIYQIVTDVQTSLDMILVKVFFDILNCLASTIGALFLALIKWFGQRALVYSTSKFN